MTAIIDERTFEKEIEKDIEALSNLSNGMQSKKEKVIEKLYTAIEKMKYDPDSEKGSQIEAKTAMISAFTSLAADTEKQKRDTLKFKAGHQADQDLQSNISEIIVNMLNGITADTNKNTKPINPNGVDMKIEARITAENIEILDDEVVLEKTSQTTEEVRKKFNLSEGE